jgi:mercuric ion binding protein
MRTIRIFSVITVLLAITGISFGQKVKTETFNVSGNCGMCKSNIEKAAKTAGASYALWNKNTKVLTVKYSSASTNTAKIQQQIATVGYDNAGAKATNEAYDKLHGCCKYERADASKEACCESEEKCTHETAKMYCCKDGKCTKEGHDGKDCCKEGDHKMDCCKDGKCSKPGHDGKDCCKH